jgi:hypothetical protein
MLCTTLAVIAMLCETAHANILYDVNTSATSGGFNPSQGQACSVSMGYDSRLGTSGGLGEPGLCGWLSFQAGGTPNTLGLTSSFDNTSAGGTDGSASSSSAAADLATGSIHLDTSVTLGGGGVDAESAASAQLVDQLTFNIPDANPSTLTTISFDYSLDGLFSGQDAQDEVSTLLSFGSGEMGVEWTGTLSPLITVESPWNSQNVSCFTTSCFNVSGSFDVMGASPTVFFFLETELACSGHDNCSEDYSNTGTFSLSLPSGVTYTSASGVFLTQTEAPEPGSMWFLLSGLAGIIAFRSRARLWGSR